jgi:crotonobetainyl-CoA:carnitine CoA-transferase CaiB-like acyl-CoA transferase
MLKTGDGQFVDVSAQTAMIWTMLHARVAHAIQGFEIERAGSVLQAGAFTLPVVHECADGYVVLIPNGATMRKMIHWLVEDGIVPEEWIDGEDWPTYDLRFIQQQSLAYELDEVVDAIRRYALRHTKQEMLERGLRENVTVAPVSTMEDLTRFRQLEERGYWLLAPLPDGREVPVPGIIAHLSETPLKVRHWAPRLGQHNREILAKMLGLSEDQLAAASGAVTS